MTENDKPAVPAAGEELNAEQANAIGGGECTAEVFVRMSSELKTAYENLIDFTSYVMERVSGGPPP